MWGDRDGVSKVKGLGVELENYQYSVAEIYEDRKRALGQFTKRVSTDDISVQKSRLC